MEIKKVKKLYYSISEVSEISQLKQYVLRYWETEFPSLKPKKNKAGNRIYKADDLDLILEIKNLLHKRKFTIKCANHYLIEKKNNSKLNQSNDKIIKLRSNANTKII